MDTFYCSLCDAETTDDGLCPNCKPKSRYTDFWRIYKYTKEMEGRFDDRLRRIENHIKVDSTLKSLIEGKDYQECINRIEAVLRIILDVDEESYTNIAKVILRKLLDD